MGLPLLLPLLLLPASLQAGEWTGPLVLPRDMREPLGGAVASQASRLQQTRGWVRPQCWVPHTPHPPFYAKPREGDTQPGGQSYHLSHFCP